MRLVAEQMGDADWPRERRYPRYQILSIESLLEKNAKPEIPGTYRTALQTGVGRVVEDGQESLFGERET